MQNTKKNKWFTLIEVILYVAILGIIITVVTNFSLDSFKEKNNQQSKQLVKQDADFILDKIIHEIESATKINHFESIFWSTIPAGKIVLNKENGTVVTISQSWGSVYYQENLNDPQKISNPNTEITKLNFLADVEDGNIPTEIQVKMDIKSKNLNLPSIYSENFQTSVVPKNADIDADGCLDIIDQYPLDPACCQDSDGDGFCDAQDNCPLIHNMDQRDDDNDGIGFHCDDEVDIGWDGTWGEDDNGIVGGSWTGESTVDSCIYTCNYSHSFWQEICKKFECFYTGDSFETDQDNDEYAGIGQVFSMEDENMYWKKTFTLTDITVESIPKVDRIKIFLNYCHSWSRLDTWWLRARCQGNGHHINGYFVDTQDVDLFNHITGSWDTIWELDSHLTNNDEIYATIEYSQFLTNYINNNKEITVRLKFRSNWASWWDPQRWYFVSPARYLLVDAFNIEVHVQNVAHCGDRIREMDEQCDDGSFCEDGTDCTGTGVSLCVWIWDEECKARDIIGADCSAECLNENAVCGNDLIEVGEECDDNNTNDGDGCNSNCEIESCGNATVEQPEECDLWTRCDLNWSYCTSSLECVGIGDESCKMRNGDDDKCSEFCLNEICGNGRLDYGEECDDNNTNDGDGCNSICHLEWCPNGIIDTGEECDDDNTIDDDDCNNSCRIQECGDGIKNRAEEECDDGKQCGDDEKTPCNADSDCLGIGDGLCKTRSLDSCDANCKIEFAVCGNNLLEAGEECDDNNLNDGDGCSHTCMNEYIATYDFTAPTQNGINKNKTAWTVSSTTEKPTTWPSFTVANNFNASRPFQVEFNKIAELDWKSENFYYTKIENENNAYFTLDTYQSKYVLHKFEIKIDENEYRLDEVSPKRIESIELQWEGYPTLTGFLWAESRYISLYAWKNDTWTELKVQKWNGWDQADRTLTVEITNDIWSYIDTNRKLNILVGVNKQGANILNTDFFQMQIKAYWYRENYE